MWSKGYGRTVGPFERGHVFLERNIQKLADLLHRFQWPRNEVFIVDLVHGTPLRLENITGLSQVLVSQHDPLRKTKFPEKPVGMGCGGDAPQNGIQIAPKENKARVRKLFGQLQRAVIPVRSLFTPDSSLFAASNFLVNNASGFPGAPYIGR